MKINKLLVASSLTISGVFFGVLSLLNLPESVTEWVISDIMLGAILYVNYLVIALAHSSSSTRMSH